MGQVTTVNYTDEYHFTPWDSADKESDCCEWEGVKCNLTTGRVIELALNLTMSYSSRESGGGWYFNASLFLPFEVKITFAVGSQMKVPKFIS